MINKLKLYLMIKFKKGLPYITFYLAFPNLNFKKYVNQTKK